MKPKAQLVIIGAGIVGCSTAYFLAKQGYDNIIVLDKGELFENDGSTSHAPGGVNPISSNLTMARMAGETIDLVESLPTWKPGRKPCYMVGGVDVARTIERMDEVKRLYSNAKSLGIDVQMIGKKDVETLFPLFNADPFLGGLFTPRKPVVAGSHVCGSLAAEAQRIASEQGNSITFIGHTQATDFDVESNLKGVKRIVGIKTNNPSMPQITCEQVLLCTNIWTPALSEKLGVTIPLMPAEHQYLKSAPLPELAHVSDRSNAEHEIIYPSLRDMDGGLYYRHWWDSMGVGSYHHRPIMVDSRALGKTADHPFTPADFVDAQRVAEESIPALKGVDYPYKINGMFSFSVDGLPVMGPTTVNGLWVAAAVWVTNSGGVGKAMAEWISSGETEHDMRSVNVNRFLDYQTSERFIQLSCAKAYVEVHDIIHPAQWTSKPRDIRHSPFHQKHVEMGAQFLPTAGLEMPYWLEENQRLLEQFEDQVPERDGWGAMYWSPIQGAEHLAMCNTAGLFDLTSLAIIEVQGPDAALFADYICTSKMDIAVGKVAYTLWCTHSGGIKRDLAAARIADDRYWFFTGAATAPQEIAWLKQNSDGYDVAIRDLSRSYAALGLFGPHARKILEQVTPADVSNDAFPLYTWQEIEVGMHRVFAMRISYVGELGWELHMPMDVALAVREELWQAGQDLGLVSCGVGAMRSMRLEKGYRLWGSDIYTEHNPYEAGMGWLVKLKKASDFVGKEALIQKKASPITRRLVTITLDDPNAVLTGNEPIFLAGSNGTNGSVITNGSGVTNSSGAETCIGMITSGNYGYSVGKYVAMGYLPIEHTTPGTQLEVEHLAQRFPAVVAEDVLFDPKNERMKA